MRHRRLTALAAAAVLAASGAAAASAAPARSTDCRAAVTSLNWRAVFGHDATLAAAKARVKRLQAANFKTAKVENRGCNDFASVLESPEFSKYSVRDSFAREAAAMKLVVTYAQPGNAKAKPGDVNVVFGRSTTLAGAARLLARVGTLGWRESDIAYGGPRSWKVVWPNVPGTAAEETVAQAMKSGLAVELELVGQ